MFKSRRRTEISRLGPWPMRIIGAPSTPVRDVYQAFLKAPWPLALGWLVANYLCLNLLFALAYFFCGGVANLRPGHFGDAFNFSIQTMGTIGYGQMFPVSRLANLLVAAESVTSIVVTALATGLLFAKFSRTTARIVFSKRGVICLFDGVPTLMFRLGNQRGNNILDAHVRVTYFRTERTAEGHVFYRALDLKLARDRAPLLSRSWTALHALDAASPLCGCSPDSFDADEAEIMITVLGIDDTSMQTVHASNHFVASDISWGARLADVLHEEKDGSMVLDLGRFDTLEPTTPTPEFPYPRAEDPAVAPEARAG